MDGNKRAATVGLTAFLRVNGYIFDLPNDTRLGKMLEVVIVRSVSDEGFAEALAPHVIAAD